MDYTKMVGFPKPTLTGLKGIGDEPLMPLADGATMIMHKTATSCRGAKIDCHASFPKGLPKAFQLREEHIR